jgi:hypothetical protein
MSNIGKKARILRCEAGYEGMEGVIIKDDGSDCPYGIEFVDGNYEWYTASQVKLLGVSTGKAPSKAEVTRVGKAAKKAAKEFLAACKAAEEMGCTVSDHDCMEEFEVSYQPPYIIF